MDKENDTTVHIENKRDYSFRTNLDEHLIFYCNTCRSSTSHKTLADVTYFENDSESDLISRGSYRISECSGCHSICFVEQTLCSEDDYFWHEGEIPKFTCRVYPIPEEGALTESRLDELEFVLPPRVKRIYEETLIAIKNKLFVIAGIGLRSVLDAVCRDKGIGKNGDTLANRLKIMLEEKHLITPDEKTILDAVKSLGNNSAHEGKALSSYEIKSALIVIQHILDKLYLLPEIKQEFENNKQDINFVDDVFEQKTEEE